jgi:glutathione S-transferase
LKLITSLTSPFGRKIRILLQEKNIPCDIIEDVPWNADTVTPEYNPLGKIPVLVRDDGSTLFDSRVIAQYLDGLSSPALIPAESEARIQVLRWEALADGISDAAAAVFIERRRDASLQSQDWIARQLGKVRAGLGEAERLLVGDNCNGSFSLADVALASALGYVQLRLSADVPLADYPRLAAYFLDMEKRPAIASTRPPA